MKREVRILAALLLPAACGMYLLRVPGGPRASGPLISEAYVWQRRWDEKVSGAIRDHGPEFGRLVALAAEVAW